MIDLDNDDDDDFPYYKLADGITFPIKSREMVERLERAVRSDPAVREQYVSSNPECCTYQDNPPTQIIIYFTGESTQEATATSGKTCFCFFEIICR